MNNGSAFRRQLFLGTLVFCAAVTCKPKARTSPPADPASSPDLQPRESVCFNLDRSIVDINDEGIWTSKGGVYDAQGRQRLPMLKPSYYGMLASVAFDRDLIVAAGTPDPDGSLAYWMDAFSRDGQRLWSIDLDPSQVLEGSPISVKVAILPQTGKVSVVIYGQVYESDFGAKTAGHVHPTATNLAELRTYSRDGKLLTRRKLMSFPVANATFSTNGELALAGTANRRVDLGALTGSPRLWIQAGSAFVAYYDEQGRPQWARAVTGPGRVSTDIRFDDHGDLWTALSTCGARGAEPYSVLGGSNPVDKLVLHPLCTGYYVFDKSGTEKVRSIDPCTSPPPVKGCPAREDPLFLVSAGFALLGSSGHVFGLARDTHPERQVIDLCAANDEGPIYYLWPLTDAGPGLRLPGTVAAAGFFHDQLCVAVKAAPARLHCDRWVETSRSREEIAVCLPASPDITQPGGPS